MAQYRVGPGPFAWQVLPLPSLPPASAGSVSAMSYWVRPIEGESEGEARIASLTSLPPSRRLWAELHVSPAWLHTVAPASREILTTRLQSPSHFVLTAYSWPNSMFACIPSWFSFLSFAITCEASSLHYVPSASNTSEWFVLSLLDLD